MRTSLFGRLRRCAYVVALGVPVLAATLSSAQPAGDELDRQAYDVYQQVLSPFCPGRSLNDCPSSKAHELKLSMRQKLEQGVPPEVVLEEIFKQFGDQYRAVPRYAGVGKLVWWAPGTFLVVGALVAMMLARGRRRSEGSAPGGMLNGTAGIDYGAGGSSDRSAQPLSDDLRRQIDSELARLE